MPAIGKKRSGKRNSRFPSVITFPPLGLASSKPYPRRVVEPPAKYRSVGGSPVCVVLPNGWFQPNRVDVTNTEEDPTGVYVSCSLNNDVKLISDPSARVAT